MNPQNDWARLKELFDRALPLNAEGRARLLDRECSGDRDLRRKVEELLAAHEGAGEFLADPTGPPRPPDEPWSPSRTPTHDVPGPMAGTMIGPYKLLQEIGEGGFGVVFMAEQQSPMVRRVAVKVIKPGMDTKQVIARFEGERQALALMDHPNIARIFDAGATEAGRPYFVMELVRGVPITAFCDRERLDTRRRLELFIPVCQAVAHAHQKGVIHRDLKPSNVLVTLHDGRPVPMVIDFGIARAIHQRLTERTLFTELGQIVGTPEYMSPEQAEASGLDIDTRTDVYSLGALLYELLTGAPLFDPRRLRSLAFREIQRVLMEEEPPRPSARVSSLRAPAAAAAERRGVQAPQLVRLLRGDPDWIVVKAIAKDRTRRYDSAGALAADIERHLRSEPVSASPPGLGYRASRFVRRHRVAVGMAAAIGFALALGAVVATVGFVRARRAERQVRVEARRNALDAQAMRALLKDDVPTYRARVEEAITLQRSAVPADSAALADYLVNTIGLLAGLEFLGATPAPVDSFRRRLEAQAVDLLLAIETPSPSVIENLVIVRDHLSRVQPDRLPDVIRRSLILRGRSGAPDSALADDRRLLTRLLVEAGERELRAGRVTAARPVLSEALSQLERSGDVSPLDLSFPRGALGACLVELGEHAAAESLLLAAYQASGAREQLVRLVRLYERWGKGEKALSFARRTQVASTRDLGPLPGPSTVAGRGAAFSGKLGDRWIWVFGAAAVKGRPLPGIRWTSWAWTTDRDARDGVHLRHPVDSNGVPLELLALTPAERERRDSVDGWLNISAAAVIEDPTRNRSLILYVKVAGGLPRVGSSLAIWPVSEPTPHRAVVRPGAPEPTLLFQGDEPDFSVGALAFRDTLYLYGRRNDGTVVGRAPLARALDRNAWRFHAGGGHWSSALPEAITVAATSPNVSVHWNGHLGKFVLMDFRPLTQLLEMRTADRPEGPWSSPEVIHTAMRPSLNWVARPAVHTGLAREAGRVIYLTYERQVGFLDAESRLVEVTLK